MLALRTRFTTYKLKQAAALRSICAWRLFKCLQSWRDKGLWKPCVEEFTTATDPPSSRRDDLDHLGMLIIEPAIPELREKESLDAKWKPIAPGER